ncbi:MAG TPA: hypothetical protein PLJ21_13285 [Pseudobdellovibrionaceae bacterium]|nr:hypothetical protein [Pseudobdellovibrionaceae bacterium]
MKNENIEINNPPDYELKNVDEISFGVMGRNRDRDRDRDRECDNCSMRFPTELEDNIQNLDIIY